MTPVVYLQRFAATLRAQAADPLSRGWATVFGGTLARLALGFVASVLVARALGPASFGIYATLGAVSAIGGALADLGLSAAAVRRVAAAWPSDPALARRRGFAFLMLRAALAAALALISLLIAAPLAALLPGRPPPELVLLALLGVVATGLSGAVSALLQATGAFRSLALVLIANSGLTALLALALAAAGRLTVATALGVLGIGTSLVSLALGWRLLPLRRLTNAQRPTPNDQGVTTFVVRRTPRLRLRERLRRTSFVAESRELFRFGGWVWLASGCAMLAAYLDVLLVGRWLPPAAVGLYALASNLAGKADAINHSLHAVLLPAASRLDNPHAMRGYVRRGLARSAALSLLLLPLVLLAGPLIELFYGPAFRPAAGVFQLLLGVAIFDLWATPLVLLAYPADRPRLLAAGDALRVGVLATVGAWLIPSLGLSGAALARLGARVAGAALILAGLRFGHRAGQSRTPGS